MANEKVILIETGEISAPDLTQRPPRSPRCRLGGYVILPRMLDKGRATVVGRNGEYLAWFPTDLEPSSTRMTRAIEAALDGRKLPAGS